MGEVWQVYARICTYINIMYRARRNIEELGNSGRFFFGGGFCGPGALDWGCEGGVMRVERRNEFVCSRVAGFSVETSHPDEGDGFPPLAGGLRGGYTRDNTRSFG